MLHFYQSRLRSVDVGLEGPEDVVVVTQYTGGRQVLFLEI